MINFHNFQLGDKLRVKKLENYAYGKPENVEPGGIGTVIATGAIGVTLKFRNQTSIFQYQELERVEQDVEPVQSMSPETTSDYNRGYNDAKNEMKNKKYSQVWRIVETIFTSQNVSNKAEIKDNGVEVCNKLCAGWEIIDKTIVVNKDIGQVIFYLGKPKSLD